MLQVSNSKLDSVIGNNTIYKNRKIGGGRMFIVSRDRPEMDANLIDFNWIIFVYKNRRGGAGGRWKYRQ